MIMSCYVYSKDVDWKNVTDFQQYFISLYWSVTTVTTVG